MFKDEYTQRYFDPKTKKYGDRVVKKRIVYFTKEDLIKRKFDFEELYKPNDTYLHNDTTVYSPECRTIIHYEEGLPSKWLKQDNVHDLNKMDTLDVMLLLQKNNKN